MEYAGDRKRKCSSSFTFTSGVFAVLIMALTRGLEWLQQRQAGGHRIGHTLAAARDNNRLSDVAVSSLWSAMDNRSAGR